MRTLRRWMHRLAGLAASEQDEQRLQAEIEEHIALQTEENLRAGLGPAEARRQALLKFGSIESMRETYRHERVLPFLDTLTHDTRHALRRLRKSPAFTVTTVITLALGIGATTSIFTLVHAVLLSSLSVSRPDQLLKLGKESRCCYENGYSQDKEFSLVSYALYQHFRDNSKGFAELAAFSAFEPLLGVRRTGTSEPAESAPGEFVSGNYFRMFGLRPYAGRLLMPADDRPSAPPVAVMSYRLWQQRYGSDPSIIGAVFNLDQKPFTVIGITPPAFFGDSLRASAPDFFLPLNTEPYLEVDADLNKYSTHWLDLIGRIQPPATPASIEAHMRVELRQWLRSHWGEMSADERASLPRQILFLTPGGAGITSMREEYEHWLRILMLAAGFVLAVVCANVANLLLVRGMERRQQTSLSVALGARPSRLIRQALTESILLSLAGGAAGLLIAFAGTRLILHFAFPANTGAATVPISASPSVAVLLFTFFVSLLTGVAFGMAPAWMATRVDPIEALRGAARSTSRTGSLPRRTLVVIQAALALVLLSASGLLTTALHRLESQDLGFDVDRRIVMNIEPRLAGYRYDQLTPLYQRISDALSAIPGVAAVALTTYSPQTGVQWGGEAWVNGNPDPGLAAWDRVTPGYFDAVGNPILRGRGFSAQDSAGSAHVAVVNEAFANRYFNHDDPIGNYFGRSGPASSREYEIVGVVKNIRNLTYSINHPNDPFYFLPESQHDFAPTGEAKEISPGSHFLHEVVIVTRPGASLPFAALRQAMASVDPNLPIISIHTLEEQVSAEFRQQRLIARLTSFFGILSLVLSCLGLYGITAWNAGQRTNEIGIRMALGADRGNVIALVLRGAFGLIGLGLVAGLPISASGGRVLGSLLYGTNPNNPMVIVLAVVVLGFSAFIASLIPALRASTISPLDALRAE